MSSDEKSGPSKVPGIGYMQVGTGSTSASAARLQAILDDDSGYGGSTAADGLAQDTWHPGPTQDRFTPTNMLGGDDSAASEQERRAIAIQVHQLFYNRNRTALSRAITQTVDTLQGLQEMNVQWPAHYPTLRQLPEDHASERNDSRPVLRNTSSTLDNSTLHQPPARPEIPRRAETSVGELQSTQSSSASASQAPPSEPRLVTPQLARNFSVLKIELKIDGLPQSEIVHMLEKQSIASLLDNQINNSIRHLFSLRERIEDTSSKVLVTGDLNAGKSTFCNALLRRKILPEDQQPCTSIFCEVHDCRQNRGVEEVHAIPHGSIYNHNDESTYRVFGIQQLDDVVIDSEHYSMCKIYIKDIRPIHQSLLSNGVVDIALIDAPGLNKDSVKTTAVFARQEEIDVVVFVVSAANHFTLSATQFITNAAREKAYMFMVVNGFDNIRDQRRCQEMILQQIAHLSPATFKESSELVHFVSSNAIPMATAGGPGPDSGGPESGGTGSEPVYGNDPPDDHNDSSDKDGKPGSPPKDKGKGKQKQAQDDFSELEASLRQFVLEKRARSKLAPAKTYLLNVLSDLDTLATVNSRIAQDELGRVAQELDQLEPMFEKFKKARVDADENVSNVIEEISDEVYTLTRSTLSSLIACIAERDLGVQYSGLFGAYAFADELKAAMLSQVTETVRWCEERAREKTIRGVNGIKSIGLLHLGDQYADLTFRSEKMFKSRRDALARRIHFETELWDFFDLNGFWNKQETTMAGTSIAVTLAGVVGSSMVGGVGWLNGFFTVTKLVGADNARRMVLPGLILAGKCEQFCRTSSDTNSTYSSFSDGVIRRLSDSANSASTPQ